MGSKGKKGLLSSGLFEKSFMDSRATTYSVSRKEWVLGHLMRCMYWNVRFVYERYRLPIMITENGLAANDVISLEGQVHDPQRIDFIRRYLGQLKRAVGEGIPVLGYQHWSVMDNFEWAEGYDPRFGLIFVDYATGRRIIKDSAWEYRKIIESNGMIL